MHSNMKYYVISMGGIFISLGIGMLVGFNLNYDQELSKQQSEIIADLDNRFDKLKATNDSLEDELKKLNLTYDKTIAFMNENLDKLVLGELEGHNIGIISTNPKKDENTLIDTINKANGNIAFNISFTNKEVDENISSLILEKLNIEIKNNEELVLYVLDILNNENAQSKLEELKKLELLSDITLASNYQDCNSVVLNGDGTNEEFDSKFKKLNEALIEKLKSGGSYIIGVDTTDSTIPYIDLYSEKQITTVNNINEKSGQLALVLALKDRKATGNFGTGENVDSLIPYTDNK